MKWEKNKKQKRSSKLQKKVIDAFGDDFTETRWFKSTVYDSKEQRETIEMLLNQ